MIKFLLFFLLAVSAYATDKALTFEDFFTVRRAGTPVVSKDGSTLVFTLKQADLEQNTYTTHLWAVDRKGGDARQLTTQGKTNTNPVFAPDREVLYFISNRSGTRQVWKMNISGQDQQQVTDLFDDITSMTCGPAGQLLLQRSVPDGCGDEDCIEKFETDFERNAVKARVIERLMYRHWNEWLEGKYSHLFLYRTAEKDIRDVTPGRYHSPPISLGGAQDYTFSPDGTEICFVTNRDKQLATSTNNDIFLLNLKTNNETEISISDGNDNTPVFSPDGRYIAFASMQRAGFEADRQMLMLYDRKKEALSELTSGFTLSVDEIVWSASGEHLYFTAGDKGNISLYKVARQGGKIIPVLTGHYISGVRFVNKDEIVFAKQSSRTPVDLYRYHTVTKKMTRLTTLNEDKLSKYERPAYEEFWFKGAMGDSVHGFIMKPPGFEEGKKYPAVHLIHGGPQGMWSNNFHYRWNYQMFAAPGYVVYWINFHGSRGYGQAFTDIISGHWGDYPYEDVVKATEYVIANYDYIDGGRLGAAGASYGGFMINWIAGHENPYKCLVSHDGVYEQISMWGATEELWFPEWEFGGTPWTPGNTYQKWSPANLAKNFKTPMLVIHGEHDYRVPYTQGLQLFSALQRQSVPSRLLFFPDEDHFVRKPQNARLWWKTVHEWLATYLGN